MTLIDRFKDGLGFIKICKNWYQILPDYLIYTIIKKSKPDDSKIVIVKLRNGLTFSARSKGNDFGIIKELVSDDIYCVDKYKTKLNYVIDVGANIGVFSCFAALYSDKVIAIEPDPNNYKILCENIKLNGFNNVIPVQVALSDASGKGSLYISEGGTSDHSIIPFNTSKVIEVKLYTLKDIINSFEFKDISYIKIDCEGCEYNLLKSSLDSLMLVPHIAIDSHHGHTEKMIEILKNNNFNVRVEKIGVDIIHADKK